MTEIERCYDCGGLMTLQYDGFDQAPCRCAKRKVKYALPERKVEIDIQDVLSWVDTRAQSFG